MSTNSIQKHQKPFAGHVLRGSRGDRKEMGEIKAMKVNHDHKSVDSRQGDSTVADRENK